MKNKFSLHIPNPCSADWNQMNAADKGRFCLACQKTVVDFSDLSDAAIKDFFQNNAGKVCGRFKGNQLKEYSSPAPLRSVLAFLSVLSLTPLIAPAVSFAQPTATFLQTKANPEATLPAIKREPSNPSEIVYTVSGKVWDKENSQPLPGVVISIKGTKMGTISQADGSFKLQVNNSYSEKVILTFSFIGYETKEKEISFKDSSAVGLPEINLALDAQLLGEVVYVGQVNSSWYQPKSLWWQFKQLFRQ